MVVNCAQICSSNFDLFFVFFQGRAENAELQENCGNIIGLIRFKDCLNSTEAKKKT